MKNDTNPQAIFGGIILFIFLMVSFRSCTDREFQYKFNSCMAGYTRYGALLMAIPCSFVHRNEEFEVANRESIIHYRVKKRNII